MSGLVVDASVSVSWLLDDEDDPRADMALEEVEANGCIVPQLWHIETRNSLLISERRGRIASDSVDERLRSLGELPIETDARPSLQAAFELAKTHGLTMYDAMYLELAKREGATLATLDRALRRAALAEGLQLLA